MKPELGQRRENEGEISSVLRGKKSGYVLDEDPPVGWNKLICDAGELEEEAAAFSSSESGAASGDAEVLAGETAAEEINTAGSASPKVPFGSRSVCTSSVSVWLYVSNASHVVVDGHSGEPLSQDSPSPLVDLTQERMLESGAGESRVHSPDPAEE